MYKELFADLVVLAFNCNRYFTDKWLELSKENYNNKAWEYDCVSEDLAWLFYGNDIDFDVNDFEQNYRLLFCEIEKLKKKAFVNYFYVGDIEMNEVYYDIFNSLNDVLCVVSEKQKKLEEKYYGRI